MWWFGAIVLVLVGLAHLALLGLVVVLIANSTSFSAGVVAAYVVLHAVGAAGGLIGGISMLRGRASRTPLISALTVVFASIAASVLVAPNAPTYIGLALGGAFGAVVAWQFRSTPTGPTVSDAE